MEINADFIAVLISVHCYGHKQISCFNCIEGIYFTEPQGDRQKLHFLVVAKNILVKGSIRAAETVPAPAPVA